MPKIIISDRGLRVMTAGALVFTAGWLLLYWHYGKGEDRPDLALRSTGIALQLAGAIAAMIGVLRVTRTNLAASAATLGADGTAPSLVLQLAGAFLILIGMARIFYLIDGATLEHAVLILSGVIEVWAGIRITRRRDWTRFVGTAICTFNALRYLRDLIASDQPPDRFADFATTISTINDFVLYLAGNIVAALICLLGSSRTQTATSAAKPALEWATFLLLVAAAAPVSALRFMASIGPGMEWWIDVPVFTFELLVLIYCFRALRAQERAA